MKLKTLGAALLSAAVLSVTSATAFAGMLPGGGIPIPIPSDSLPSASETTPDISPAPETPNDPSPNPGADNPTTGAQGVVMVIGAAALAGAAVVVSRRKK